LMFILALLVTSIISSAICQDAYNKFSSVTAPAPEAPQQPAVA
jgi:hypothetical protein